MTSADRRAVKVGAVVLVVLVGLGVAVGSQLDGATHPDDVISSWFVRQRTPLLNHVTAAFSWMASTEVVVAIALAVIVVTVLRRRLESAVIVLFAMGGEIIMFLTITAFVDRPRPNVVRLDSAPPTSSFPSGHTLATFVLWNTIAVVAVRQAWRPGIVVLARVLAVLMPIAVGLSRIYRGMHHATDVVASLVLGAAWVAATVVLFSPAPHRQWTAPSAPVEPASADTTARSA
ncbi:MAG: phospholipid phosphatase [Ilumatobacteraceae bacterium]|nr:phospholipid phosphatase [Ilumatobacteraceae bacterium]